jgi:excisionase family DNA binding protein
MAGRRKKVGPLITVDDVRRILPYSKPHIYRLARDKALPSVKFGRAVMFEREAVERFIEDHRRKTA